MPPRKKRLTGRLNVRIAEKLKAETDEAAAILGRSLTEHVHEALRKENARARRME